MDYKKYLNVYDNECVLPGNKQTVKFKPITTANIKRLLTYENEKNPIIIEEVFDELINQCVISENFNIDEIYVQDRYFLLMEIRKASKGDIYEFQFKCPKCKSDNLTGINFNTFKVKEKPKVTEKEIVISKQFSVFVDHITRGQQKEAYGKIENKDSIDTEMMFNNVAASIRKIKTPEGEQKDLKIEDKLYILDNLSFSVFNDVKKWYEENDFGLDMKYKVKCVHCAYVSGEQKMNIDSDFF